ncbi:MAG: alpha/beta hydrolase [Thermomicrobiales bacterium]
MNDVVLTGRLTRPTLLILAVATALGGLFTLIAPAGATPSSGQPDDNKPTIVLVHGSWADASGWTGVIKQLQREGYPVIAPANPLRSLSGDSAYVASVLASIDGPIVLVGHSYGGAVISNAAAGNPNVKALVYIAGFAVAEDESLLGLLENFPGSQALGAIRTVPFPLADGSTGIDTYLVQEQFRDVFVQDVTPGTAAALAATQRPATFAAFEEPSAASAWESIPSWFLIPQQDRVIPPDAQRFMAERAGGYTVEVKGSHAIMVSKPHKVFDIIERAAKSVE